ncbi:MAG: hypothetical protein GF341_04560 [candidate division Zixibacteria bacterium]|nr:hypothetical protein [candidate division Zixibacteria bacterium]
MYRRRSIEFALIVTFLFSTVVAINVYASTNWLTLRYVQRMRIETTDNAITLSREANGGRSVWRHRTSLQGITQPHPQFTVTGRLTNEMYYHFVPEARAYDFNEIFVDLLRATWDSIGGLPLSATVGRQNIILGEGFVVMDGGPLDGSRSIYFNAARVDWTIAPHHSLSLIACYQPEMETWFPVIHDQDRLLIEQPEQGLIAYYSGAFRNVDVQGYVIRKDVKSSDLAPTSGYRYCPGVRVRVPLQPSLSVTGELALQRGAFGSADVSAYGGYSYLSHSTSWPRYLPSRFTLGGLYLSGDDPQTADREDWDPLFSRWPKWSESYIYTQVKEVGVARWTNTASVFATLRFDLDERTRFTLDYHHLMAPEHSDPALPFPGGRGTTRGDLIIGRLTFTMNEHLDGHVLWEGFEPGDFYFDGADGYGWGRLEVTIRY